MFLKWWDSFLIKLIIVLLKCGVCRNRATDFTFLGRGDLRSNRMKWENDVIRNYRWPGSIDRREEKEALAIQVAGKVSDHQIIGAGAGSTVYLALTKIAEKVVKEGLHVQVIPASAEISMICMQLGIPQSALSEAKPDWSFDGADEVDREGNLLKGRGGALFRETLLLSHT